MSSNKPENEKAEMDKLDAIKEIIFGENIKAYDHEFKQLKDHINKLQAENIQLMQDMKIQFDGDMKDLKKDLKKQVDDLQSSLNNLTQDSTSKEHMSQLLQEMANKLK